jgi:hypothetical protein
MQRVECNRPDPLKSDAAKGWLTSELQPPKSGTIGRNDLRLCA